MSDATRVSPGRPGADLKPENPFCQSDAGPSLTGAAARAAIRRRATGH